MTSKTLPEHGTQSRSLRHACHCDVCTEAYRAYHRNRRLAIKNGDWNPYVDVEPARRHILALYAAGFTTYHITQLAKIDARELMRFVRHAHGRSRKRRIHADVAERILSIRPESHTPAIVSALGSIRRTQALATLGWPKSHIATLVGHHPRNFLIRLNVRHETFTAVCATYEDLKTRRPKRAEIAQHIAQRTRKDAKARLWVPPTYWNRYPDAIDDPHFTPEYKRSKAEILAEEAAWLTGGGVPEGFVAARLGITPDYLNVALTRSRLKVAA
ncbi:hypothetical protein PL81_31190 [Streptomyces sp. RSD-27]|nr:hypothetical protein PL81_31190 [Streptomyces sp. RSD-27]